MLAVLAHLGRLGRSSLWFAAALVVAGAAAVVQKSTNAEPLLFARPASATGISGLPKSDVGRSGAALTYAGVVGAATRLGEDKAASHASQLSVNQAGQLQVLWFSGTREGASDVEIRQSSLVGPAWSKPVSLLSRSGLQAQSLRHVRKLGNAVAYPQANQVLITSVSLGGWAGARVEQLIQGTYVRTLPLSPFLNISSLVRARALPLQNGGFALPVYHEFLAKAPELLVFDEAGQFTEKRRGYGFAGLLQPAALPTDSGGLLMWFRDEDSRKGLLYRTEVFASGALQTQATNLPNRDTGIDALQLPDGRFVIAHNPGTRESLALSTSRDGLAFEPSTVIESLKGAEFSYPSLALHRGQLWLSYTAQRKAIAVRAIDWRALP